MGIVKNQRSIIKTTTYSNFGKKYVLNSKIGNILNVAVLLSDNYVTIINIQATFREIPLP